jgi:hypothetical protein
MKSLAILIFFYFAVPGSGQLVWDGIPFSTRSEFAGLIIIVLTLSIRENRGKIREWQARRTYRDALKPVIVLLALLKLLTFTWFPEEDGFEACYRSIYVPLENPDTCEKSYQAPFLGRSNLGFRNGAFIDFDNTSRIDRTIDFGVHLHDWSLPFMNEYPRLGALWLSRFPFSASYGAIVENDSTGPRLLPIYGNGEISGAIGSEIFSNESIHPVDRYMFPRLIFAEVPPGKNQFGISYQYSDDFAVTPPDSAPPDRGPYALLKVGEPQSRASILKFAQLRIRGWTADVSRGRTPDYVSAVDKTGSEIARSEREERPDVARYIGKPLLVNNGFRISLPAQSLETGDVLVRAIYGDKQRTIAILSKSDGYLPTLPSVEISPIQGERSDLGVWFDADRDSFDALAPRAYIEPSLGLRALLAVIDFTTLVLVAGALTLLLVRLRESLAVTLALAAACFGLFEVGGSLAPIILGTQLTLPVLMLTLLIVGVVRFHSGTSLLVFLPTAVTLAAYKSFDQLERFHSSHGARWWGRLLYYWRDSDWYTTQGFARTVFLEGSLQGGEDLFWFQAGPRYLALISRVLLGENDVLVGIIVTSLGFFAVIVLAVQFLRVSERRDVWFVGAFSLFIGLYFMADDLISGFGFVGSSEYPTWIVILVLSGFVVSVRSESRAWPMVAFALALGYSIQLRPNQIGGSVLLFATILLRIDQSVRFRAIGTASKMICVFATAVSFSLLHNLYYGESFVPFTANAGINYKFSWLEVIGLRSGEDSLGTVWSQIRFMMYWNAPGNWAWTFLFWGAQLLWIVALAYRYKKGLLLKARSLLLLIPFGYALPMLKYQMTSYYPRHLVVINLAFLLTALMAWPHSDSTDGEEAQAAEQPATIDPAAVSAQSR